MAPTHVFLTRWMRNDTEAENIRVNGAMVRNVLAALAPTRDGFTWSTHRPHTIIGQTVAYLGTA